MKFVKCYFDNGHLAKKGVGSHFFNRETGLILILDSSGLAKYKHITESPYHSDFHLIIDNSDKNFYYFNDWGQEIDEHGKLKELKLGEVVKKIKQKGDDKK